MEHPYLKCGARQDFFFFAFNTKSSCVSDKYDFNKINVTAL